MSDPGGFLRYGDVQKRGAPATTKRREALLTWLREPTHDGLTARQIATRLPIYEMMQGRQERCSSDLRALERAGFVRSDARVGGRWWPIRPGWP